MVAARPGRAALLALFALLLVLDQAAKWLALAYLDPYQPLVVTSFFNLVLVWNRGVSFGMLSEVGAHGPTLLIVLTLVISAVLLVWLRREPRPLSRVALVMVLAGAIGNLIDRLRFEAVVDYLDFHALGYHWPAFNVADSAIVIGALLLLLDSFAGSRART